MFNTQKIMKTVIEFLESVEVDKFAKDIIKHRYNSYGENITSATQKLDTIYGFKQGFQKAIELLKTTRTMTEFKQYRRKSISEMRPYVEGEILDGKVSISQADKDNGSPKLGDMIARNPKNHSDQWLVAKQYFEDNLEEI
jgi:hypothetical protein